MFIDHAGTEARIPFFKNRIVVVIPQMMDRNHTHKFRCLWIAACIIHSKLTLVAGSFSLLTGINDAFGIIPFWTRWDPQSTASIFGRQSLLLLDRGQIGQNTFFRTTQHSKAHQILPSLCLWICIESRSLMWCWCTDTFCSCVARKERSPWVSETQRCVQFALRVFAASALCTQSGCSVPKPVEIRFFYLSICGCDYPYKKCVLFPIRISEHLDLTVLRKKFSAKKYQLILDSCNKHALVQASDFVSHDGDDFAGLHRTFTTFITMANPIQSTSKR